MIRRPPRSTLDRSSAASDVYKRQVVEGGVGGLVDGDLVDPVADAGRHDRQLVDVAGACLLYTSPSPRDRTRSRMPSSA